MGTEDTGYRHVVRIPGAIRAFAPTLVGKLSFAMVSLAMLLLVQAEQHTFLVAGLATGAFGVANVASAPTRARLVDRWGQRRTLNALAIGYAVLLIAFVAVTVAGSPAAVIVVTAALAGLFPPPIGAAMRVIWARLSPSDSHKTRAYGLDAVAEELVFTVGPVGVAGLAVLWSPAAAVLCAAALALAGTVGMTSSAGSRGVTATVPARRARRTLGALAAPGMAPMLLVLVAVGAILGSVEILAAAFADNLGNPDLAGLLLATFAAGSAAGGLVYGGTSWPGTAAHRLLILGVAMTLACGGLLLISDSPAVAIALVAVGLFLAPAMITGYLLADDLTTAAERTEASAWVNTAVNAGAALSVAGIGLLIDQAGVQTAVLVTTATAGLCILAAAPFLLFRAPTSTAEAL